ncbi:calcium-activated chloride channel regulator family member 3-like [Diadema antillarum]|uniref:calcium-activated chloride channel regulator family member 3-like n=1 Tax=Diadema antillarum TaxID=105358 RepID=UPI003A8AB12F
MPSWRFALLCTLMASWLFARGSSKNTIHLDKGKYTNILVAIDSGVTENDTLIEHIKETFKKGSGILFEATKRSLYWGEIQILVPITWKQKPDVYETATFQSFGSANIRVVEGAVRDPSVTNHAGCGEPGLDMTLTSGYLLQNVDTCSGKTRAIADLLQNYVFVCILGRKRMLVRPGSDCMKYLQFNAWNY